MKTFKIFAVAFACLAVSGCAGASYVMNEYDGIKPVDVKMPDDTYQIFDKPNAQKAMITPSMATAVEIGAMRGLTWGIGDFDVPKPRFEAAVVQFLANGGRKCEIKDGYKVLDIQWEFRYSCALETPPALPLPMKPVE